MHLSSFGVLVCLGITRPLIVRLRPFYTFVIMCPHFCPFLYKYASFSSVILISVGLIHTQRREFLIWWQRQNEFLLPRVRRSLGAKVAARDRGALSGPGSLAERARIAEVARDAEASETCKRLYVLPEGLARSRRLSLGGTLFIVVWITAAEA